MYWLDYRLTELFLNVYSPNQIIERKLTWSVLDVYFHISNKLGSPLRLDCRKRFCFLAFRKRCKWPYPNVFLLYFLICTCYCYSLKFLPSPSLLPFPLHWLFESITLFKIGILFCKNTPLLRFFCNPPSDSEPKFPIPLVV